MGAPSVEAEAGVAFDADTIEAEAIGAMMTEENVEFFTIEYSPERMGTRIKEETNMVDTREDTGIRNIPSTSAAELEAPLPQRKRIISKEEV